MYTILWQISLPLYLTIAHLNTTSASDESMVDDLLFPYKKERTNVNKPRVNKREINLENEYFYEVYPAHSSNNLIPVSTTKYFVSDVPRYEYSIWDKVTAYGHYTIVNNPLRTFSIIEPGGDGGCNRNNTELVEFTASIKQCIVAQNGGYFNTTSGNCLGNIIINEELILNNGGLINAHFGILKNGSLVTGYIPNELVMSSKFSYLIGGVGWLVRNGTSYVDKAANIESDEFEETGTFSYFVDVRSARTALGHNAEGQIIMVNVEGQTEARGLNLKQFAHLLVQEFHLVNAINLDGGGSATLVLNGTLANYPSDHCKNNPEWRCARKVSTVVCVHEPRCLQKCIYGTCINGICVCKPNYIGEFCETMSCGHYNCSNHGYCYPNGCNCHNGWTGIDCNVPCDTNHFGKSCSQICNCLNGGICSSVTGHCDCAPGFMGNNCELRCPYGLYGKNCEYMCNCNQKLSCLCDHVTGTCYTNDIVLNKSDSVTWNMGQCLIKNYTANINTKSGNKHYFIKSDFYWVSIITLSLIGLSGSIVFNIVLLWKLYNIKYKNIVVTDNTGTHKLTTTTNKNKDFNVHDKIVKSKYSFPKRTLAWHSKWIAGLNKYNQSSKNKRKGYMPLIKNENSNFEETALLS